MMMYLGISMVIVITGGMIAILMIIGNRLISNRRESTIDQIADRIINHYLPASTDTAVEGIEKMCDMFVKKVPKMMKKMKKMEEEDSWDD